MPRHSRRAGTLVLLLAAPAFAQFVELATTDDGSQLYFTSKMLLKGREPGPWSESRLYRFGPSGVTLYAERGALASKDTHSSSDGVGRPSVSGDGADVGFTYTGICGDPKCETVVNRIELRGRETLDLGPGVVQISRNGRWALVAYQHNVPQSNPMLVGMVTDLTLVDLFSGQRTTISGAPAPSARAGTLASDGGVLVMRASDAVDSTGVLPMFGVYRQGKFTALPVPPESRLYAQAISDDSSVALAYEAAPDKPPFGKRLAVISLSAGAVTTVAETKDEDHIPTFLSLSNNGRRVLYRMMSIRAADGPAYIWDAATLTSTLVPLPPGELPADGVLSGNGALAFLATTRGRLVRFDIAAKTVTDLFPQTHQCDDPGPLAAGSFARLVCTMNLPADGLDGKLTLDGERVPVLYSSSGEIGVQVPWRRDFFPPSTLSIDVGDSSPFQSSQELQVYDGAPQIFPDAAGLFGMKAVKGDWSGLLSALPAPGETFHIYMTGLGPVETRETTSVPASLTKPNPIRWSMSCYWTPILLPVDLQFAGLAPGMLGVYQTSFRMRPAFAGAEPITGFECVLQSPAMAVTFSPGSPTRFIVGSGGVITVPLTPPLPPR